MASEAQFDEGGVKMLASVAMFAAGGPTGIMGAIGFVQGVVSFMTSGGTADALNTLKTQIEQVNPSS
jgi:hypothetical protein